MPPVFFIQAGDQGRIDFVGFAYLLPGLRIVFLHVNRADRIHADQAKSVPVQELFHDVIVGQGM